MTRKDGAMHRTRFTRFSGAAALGFAVLIVASNLIAVPAGLPPPGSDIGDVTTFFNTKGRVIEIASALHPAAWMLSTLFGVGVVSVTRHVEHDRGEAWSLLGLAGLLLQNGTFAAVTAIRLALASTSTHDAIATSGLWALHDSLFVLNGAFLALALIGLSIAGRRAGLIRGWLSTLGLFSATLLFGSATLSSLLDNGARTAALLGLVGWLTWCVWIGAYGITLLRSTDRQRRCDMDNQSATA